MLAKRKHDIRLTNDKAGTTPMYRGKFWNREKRDQQKFEKIHSWYKKGDNEAVFFVDATPKSELAKQCNSIMKEVGLKIRVVERAGVSAKQTLVKSNPFQRIKCENNACALCKYNNNINCKKRDSVYRIHCKGIHENNNKGIYEGESSRSLSERFKEHNYKYRSKQKTSVFYNHMLEVHQGEMHDLGIEILSTYPGDAMLRQISEAVNIKENRPDLNKKDEWGNSNVPRERKSDNQDKP